MKAGFAINNAGVVVGDHPDEFRRAAAYSIGTGSLTEIRRPDGQPGEVNVGDVSDGGLVSAQYYEGEDVSRPRAFVHDLSTGLNRAVGPLPGDHDSSIGPINASGVGLGQSTRRFDGGGATVRSFLFDLGTGSTQDLAELAGLDYFIGADISDDGWVVGGGPGGALAYNVESEERVAIPPAAGDESFDPMTISSDGRFVGGGSVRPVPGGGQSARRAAVFDMETRTTSIVPGASDISLVIDINVDGTAVGHDNRRAFVYHPFTGRIDPGVASGADQAGAYGINDHGVVVLLSWLRSDLTFTRAAVYYFRLFPDIIGSPHADNIEAMALAGVAGGYSDGTYRPGRAVTRDQMASFLKRAFDVPDAPDSPSFPDTVGNAHEAAIRDVAAAGIAMGGEDGRYHPGLAVTRGQMAAFITRAAGLSDTSGTEFCDTAGHQFEDEIRAVAAAGIAVGGTDGCYRPNDSVTRAQMATFLRRAVG